MYDRNRKNGTPAQDVNTPAVGRGSGPVIKPSNFQDAHSQSDVDSGANAQHHTLGLGATQAYPGNLGKVLRTDVDAIKSLLGTADLANIKSFTPQPVGFSNGVGPKTGWYVDLGALFIFGGRIELGAGSSYSGPTVGMTTPFNVTEVIAARGISTDAGTNSCDSLVSPAGGTAVYLYNSLVSGAVSGWYGIINGTSPFVWANGDSFSAYGLFLK